MRNKAKDGLVITYIECSKDDLTHFFPSSSFPFLLDSPNPKLDQNRDFLLPSLFEQNSHSLKVGTETMVLHVVSSSNERRLY